MTTAKAVGYGIYWRIWGLLLVVTLIMILIDRPAAQALSDPEPFLSRGLLVLTLVVAMLLKATLIAAYFMHLRFERLAIALSVLIGLLINGAILYALILPDGIRILEMLGG